MSKILVFGHQNPDTDAIGAAIGFSYLQNSLGYTTEAVALGLPNEETQYALNQFKLPVPRVVKSVAKETDQVMLVDHNEFQQSVADIEEVSILAVVDHHRIANFQTADPLYYRAEPVGCTSTIIYKMFNEKKIAIPSEIAGMLVSAIISDTLLFKSPTCTQEDVTAANALAKLAEINLDIYGLDLLKAGTNLNDKTVEELINLDAKSFPMNNQIVRIAQINTVDIDEVLERQFELTSVMQATNDSEKYDLFLLMITNILSSASEILVVGEATEKVEAAFKVKLENQRAFLPDVVSRKKQIVPQLTEVFG